MDEIKRIKEIIKKDENFNKSFLGVKNVKTAIAIAKSKGFNVSIDDVVGDKELEDALLTAAAGGKNDKITKQDGSMALCLQGDGNTINFVNNDKQGSKS